MTPVARPPITDRQRRNRLQRRHHLAGDRAASVAEVAAGLVGLHATTASTVYLSAWARCPGFAPAHLDDALYSRRTLVKQLAMRRTMFVLPVDVLRDAVGAIGPRVAVSERTNMLRDLRRNDFDDGPDWIDAACAAVRAELADGRGLTSAELRERLPVIDRRVVVSPGKSYCGQMSMAPRVLNLMSAAGEIVRGHNRGGWHQSRPEWSAMDRWLGGPLDPPDVAAGHVGLIRRWLAAFGPGTETDLVWWLGSTKTAVRAALAELDVAEVALDDGNIGYVLVDDLPGTDDADLEPVAALLPELDPTTMGHKIRDFYLGRHAPQLFDRNGNGGQTAWWDGRIVGGWHRKPGSPVQVHLLETVSAEGRRALARRADELTDWLGDVPTGAGYAAPYQKELG
ncbi:MAG: winged helix DNA-binding domain-containing protein [Gordonia sp. (in: high G+C Gram-positive bacteria)]